MSLSITPHTTDTPGTDKEGTPQDRAVAGALTLHLVICHKPSLGKLSKAMYTMNSSSNTVSPAYDTKSASNIWLI
jgi:hypothetical protein